jgi:predicted GNAT family acetyltransferase
MSTFAVDFVDASALLDIAGAFLAAEPVANSVLNTVANRLAGVPAPAGRPQWFAVIREGSTVVGAAMRTAPFRPHPPYVLRMPEAAAHAFAAALRARGEAITAVNGVDPTAEFVARALAGGRPIRTEQQSLFEVTELVAPRPTAGALRRATKDDLDLAFAWFNAFHPAALAQSGRKESAWSETFTREDVLQRLESGIVHFWIDEGVPKQMTMATLPSFGVARVGMVYTPEESRGRGYASAAVHEVTRALLARGVRVCLAADKTNTTSNKIYEALGFRRLVDTANHIILEAN